MGAESVRPGKTLGLILAGGTSRRFGSDKRLAELSGLSLLSLCAARAILQVDVLALSAADNPAGLCLPVIPDDMPGEGPLAGMLSGVRFAQEQGFDAVATFPCDTPFFPPYLVERLETALTDDFDFALARCRDEIESAFALMRVSQRDRIEDAFSNGARSIKGLGTVLRCAFADFSDCVDGPGGNCFFNINHAADLDAAKAWLQVC